MTDDPRDDHMAPPLNPLPPVVWALALPMIAVELVVSLAARGLIGGPQGKGWRLGLIEQYAVWPEHWRVQSAIGAWDFDLLIRFAAYPFVHGALIQAVFAVVILLAIGKIIGEVFHWWAVLVVFFGASILGALVYVAIPATQAPLIGGYPGVYGLIGAFTFLLWVRLAAKGANQFRAFSMIGALMLLQLVFGALFGGGWEWTADLGGFAGGFLLSFVVVPGGWAHVRARIRQR